MDLKQLADALVEANRTGATDELLDKHYHADCVSAEASAMGEGGREVTGLDAIRGKHAWWNGAMDVHSAKAEGPFLHGEDRFAVIYDIDATEKESGRRTQMREVAVYHVKDGKIAREEFFYTT